MKNFTFLFKTLALTCLLTAWGGVETAKAAEIYSFDISANGGVSRPSDFSTSQSSTTNAFTYNDVTWSIVPVTGGSSYYWGWTSGSYMQLGSGTNWYSSCVISTNGFSENVITKVIVTTYGANAMSADLSVTVGDETFKCNGEDVVTNISHTQTSYEFEYAGGASGATGEIKITYTQPSSASTSTSGGAIYLSAIEVFDADAHIFPELAYSSSSFKCDVDEYESAKLPTLTYVEGFDGLSEITYTSSNIEVATVDDSGIVTLTGEVGEATITASFSGNDSYQAEDAQYDIKVKEAHTFDFEIHTYGMTISPSNYEPEIDHLEGKNGITMDFTLGDHYRLWQETANNGGIVDLRIYNGVSFSISAPENKTIESITITGLSNVNSFSVDSGTYSSGTWAGDAVNMVTFTSTLSSGNSQITTIDVTLNEEEATSDTISISSVGYATYYTDAEYIMPEGLVGTTVTSVNAGKDDTDFTLTMAWEYAAGTTVPAGTALVLQGAVGTYTYAITSTGAEAVSGNLLLGSETETTTTAPNGADANDYYFYKLADGEKGLGFYWDKTDGAAYTSGANKAWLAILKTEAANVKFLSFGSEDDGTTGIQAVSTSHADSDAIYTLQGVRVNNMNQKGVYIVGSKKIIVK